jgi:hypothetical protein
VLCCAGAVLCPTPLHLKIPTPTQAKALPSVTEGRSSVPIQIWHSTCASTTVSQRSLSTTKRGPHSIQPPLSQGPYLCSLQRAHMQVHFWGTSESRANAVVGAKRDLGMTHTTHSTTGGRLTKRTTTAETRSTHRTSLGWRIRRWL